MILFNLAKKYVGMNFFAFLGGIQISSVLNLYFNLYYANIQKNELIYPIIGGLFFFISRYLSMLITWNFSEVVKEGEKTDETLFNREKEMDNFLNKKISFCGKYIKKITKIRIWFYLDFLSTILGVFFILFIKSNIKF